MLETSKDLLFIIVAFCVLWLTIFLCWAIYYLIKILQDFKEGSERVDEILKVIKKRVERPPVLFALAIEGIKQLISFVRERKEEKEEEDEE